MTTRSGHPARPGGSGVARSLGLDHAEHVVGVHRTDAGLPVFAGDPAGLHPDERAWMADSARWIGEEGADAAIHRTRPQSSAASRRTTCSRS